MKKLLLLILIGLFLLPGCQTTEKPDKTSDGNTETDLTETLPTPTTANANVTSDVTEPDPTAEIPASPTEAPPKPPMGQFSYQLPEGWYVSQTESNDMEVYIFSKQDLENFSTQYQTIPADFSVVAVTISPLPEGTDPAALQQGLSESLDQYGEQDLESFVILANQIGLLDIESITDISFTSADIGQIDDRVALKLEGMVTFNEPPQMHVKSWITWTDHKFVSMFQMSHADYWPTAKEYFLKIKNSLTLP